MMGSLVSMPRYFFFCSSLPAELDGRERERVGDDARLDAGAAVRELLGRSSRSRARPARAAVLGGHVGLTRPISQASLKTSIGNARRGRTRRRRG